MHVSLQTKIATTTKYNPNAAYCATFGTSNYEFVAGPLSLVRTHLAWPHYLQFVLYTHDLPLP